MAGFNDIIGQEQIKEHFRKSLETGKISHAYIINGEKASGKEFIAKIFAMLIKVFKDPQFCFNVKDQLEPKG